MDARPFARVGFVVCYIAFAVDLVVAAGFAAINKFRAKINLIPMKL